MNLWNINLLACLIRLKSFISILITLPLSENSKVIYLTFQVSVLLWHRASAILPTPPLMIYPTTPPSPPSSPDVFLKALTTPDRPGHVQTDRKVTETVPTALKNSRVIMQHHLARAENANGTWVVFFTSPGWKPLVFCGCLMHMITSLGFLDTPLNFLGLGMKI